MKFAAVDGRPAAPPRCHARPGPEQPAWNEVIAVRPLLLPALRRLWRDEKTLQLGVDPARAVVLTDLDAPTAAVLALFDGRHTVAEITARGEAQGVTPAAVSELLRLLASCGAVV